MNILYPDNEKKKFHKSLLAAFFLHILAILLLIMNYKPPVIEIPFKPLNIKIGMPTAQSVPAPDIETQSSLQQVIVPQEAPKKDNVEERDKMVPVPAKEEASKNIKTGKGPEIMPIIPKAIEPASQIPASMKMEYKPIPMPAAGESVEYTNRNIIDENAKGSILGNRKMAEKDVVTNYTEILGLWMDKHQSYPLAAQDRNMEGDGIIRLHIDKYGNILSFELIKSTEQPILDAAIINMVESANPAPPIPDNESARWFDLPVIFRLTQAN